MWKAHTEEISQKISAGLSVLKRISLTVPFKTRQTTYKALVLQYNFDYSSCVGGIYIGIAGLTEKLLCSGFRIELLE